MTAFGAEHTAEQSLRFPIIAASSQCMIVFNFTSYNKNNSCTALRK